MREQIRATATAAAKSLHSCPTLCDPIDGSPPGSPLPGILQARTLEWVAISFSNACNPSSIASVVFNPVQPYGQQPTKLLCPRDSLDKNTIRDYVGIINFKRDDDIVYT